MDSMMYIYFQVTLHLLTILSKMTHCDGDQWRKQTWSIINVLLQMLTKAEGILS